MESLKNPFKLLLALLLLAMLVISGCGTDAGDNGITGTNSLRVSQMAAVPLVNGAPTKFSYYFANPGISLLKDIRWNVKVLSSNTNSGKNVVRIIDQSACLNLLPHHICRISLIATTPGIVQLHAEVAGKELNLVGGDGKIYVTNYTKIISANPKNILSFSPMNSLQLDDYGGSYSLFLVNNSANIVKLDSNVFGVMSSNMKLSWGNCPNPLSEGQVCQLLILVGQNKSKNFSYNLRLDVNGYLLNKDGVSALPKQQNMQNLRITRDGAQSNLFSSLLEVLAPSPGNLTATIPGLDVTSPGLFGSTLSLNAGESATYIVQLTNTTTAESQGFSFITIDSNSLKPSNKVNVTYTIDTAVASSPCSIQNGTIVIENTGNNCNYNLHIFAQASVSNELESMAVQFKYLPFGSRVTNPAPPVNKSFTLNVIQHLAQLSVNVANGSNPNAFNSVAQGAVAPSITLQITNTGTKAVNGALAPQNLPSGISMQLGNNCSGLAVGATCDATLTMSTVTPIPLGNLDSSSLTYNNGLQNTSVNLPSIPYQVTPLSVPAISMTEVITGCASGDGTTTTCLNNPAVYYGGGNNGVKLSLVFNISNASESNLTLTTDALNDIIGDNNFQEDANTCRGKVINVGGSCKIDYVIANPKATFDQQVYDNNFTYNVNYGNAYSLQKSFVAPFKLDINLSNPDVNIVSSSLDGKFYYTYLGQLTNVTINWANLYFAEPLPATDGLSATFVGVSGTSTASVNETMEFNTANAQCSTISKSCSGVITSINTKAQIPSGAYFATFMANSNTIDKASITLVNNNLYDYTPPSVDNLYDVKYISAGNFIFGSGDAVNSNKSWIWKSFQDPTDMCISNPSACSYLTAGRGLPNGIDGIVVSYPSLVSTHFINNGRDNFAYSVDGGTSWNGPYSEAAGFQYDLAPVGSIQGFGDSFDKVIIMAGGQSQHLYQDPNSLDTMHAFSVGLMTTVYANVLSKIEMIPGSGYNPYAIENHGTWTNDSYYKQSIIQHNPSVIYNVPLNLSKLPKGASSIACSPFDSAGPHDCLATITMPNVQVSISGYNDGDSSHYCFVASYSLTNDNAAAWKIYRNFLSGSSTPVAINKVKSFAYSAKADKTILGFSNDGHVYVESSVSDTNATISWSDITPSGNTTVITDAAANNDGLYLVGKNVIYFYPQSSALSPNMAVNVGIMGGSAYKLKKISCDNDYPGGGSGRCIAIGLDGSNVSMIVSTVPH